MQWWQNVLMLRPTRMARLNDFRLLLTAFVLTYPVSAFGQAGCSDASDQAMISQGESVLDLVNKVRHTQVGEAPTHNNPALANSHHPKRILVRFAPGYDNLQQQEIHASIDKVKWLRNYSACPGLCLIEADVADYERALASYKQHAHVIYAEPDTRIQLSTIPNDPLFDQLWSMQNLGQTINGTTGLSGADMGATHGWELWTGDPNYRIAVIDSGIDYTHVDLIANIWTNPGEIPNNGIDDDGNGYIDDIHGYDTVNDDGDPFDDNGHGTHVAGTIGAVGDNQIGVAGVNWHCQLIAIKAFDSNGEGFVSDVIEAIEYVMVNGINLSNNSYGFDSLSQALADTIAASMIIDHLFVTAAGNDVGRNIDNFPKYPASYGLDNILVATATDSRDVLSFIANIGPNTIDVGAPGQQILSTFPGNTYLFLTGTSMATAYTTGLAALLRSREPAMDALAVKQQLISTTHMLSSLQERTRSGGIIDASAALGDCDRNTILDSDEILAGAPDCNLNNKLDSCEPDCDQDGLIDACAISQQLDTDCNQNSLPDSCDIAIDDSVDCDTNQILDECELLSGADNDVNMNGILDVCEFCETDSDCVDSNPCVSTRCLNNFCESSVLDDVPCDDGNACTENDHCQVGECVGNVVPTTDCGPLFTTKVSHVNGQLLPGGAQQAITVSRGDVLTIEWFGQRWSPRSVVAYNLLIDREGYTSGTTGRVGPDITNTGVIGAFIDEIRADFIFAALPHISILFDDSIDFLEYIGVLILEDDCAIDDETPAYLGSLDVRVSDTASGIFQLCPQDVFNSIPITFFVECEQLFTITPSELQCVAIDIPLGDCDRSPDCNSNGSWDVCDIAQGMSLDCNRNDIPDDCDLTTQDSLDCNNNEIPDECDIASGLVSDCDLNGVPNMCEPDCNGNGQTDACDIQDGLAFDCNNNGTLDVCDIANGISRDCYDRGNSIPDECESDCNMNDEADTCDLALGISIDRDANTIPDDCQSTLLVPTNFPTIAQAIEAAQSGDEIVLTPGTYGGNGNLFLDFGGKLLTVRCGGSRDDCIIDCDGARFAFALRDDETTLSRIQRLTIRNCGAGVSMERGASVTIRNCVIENSFGAAIFGSRSQAVIEDCLITGTTGFAALNFVTSQPTIQRTRIVGNYGRGIFSDVSSVDLLNSTIADNGRFRGGGLFLRGSRYTIDHCTIANNFGSSAPALFASDAQVTISNSVIWNNIESIQPGNDSDVGNQCVDLLCPTEPAVIIVNKSQLTLTNTLIDGSISSISGDDTSIVCFGEGLMSAAPRFVKASPRDDVFAALEVSDYHLSAESPCINTGQRLFQHEAMDIDQDSRVLFSRTDLGSDEATSFADCDGNGLPDGQDIVAGRRTDCNNNGRPDSCDVQNGHSFDDDGNGIPDECEMGMVVLTGSRHLELTIDRSNVPIALRVTSPWLNALPCDNVFISVNQQFQDSPYYQAAHLWESVIVSGSVVQPDTDYTVELWTLSSDRPMTILTQLVRTNLRGDMNGDGHINVSDLYSMLQRATSSGDETALIQFDIAPCQTDRAIDASDVMVVIGAFTSDVAALESCVPSCP